MSPIHLLPTGFSELFAQVTSTGKLSQADRYGMLAALLNGSINPEEMQAIDRILYAVRQGWVRVVDEISVVL